MIKDQERIMMVPPFAFSKSLPKLSGLDPEEYAGLKPQQVATRQAWLLEMETQHVRTFSQLIKQCKDILLFKARWGEHVLISQVVEYELPPEYELPLGDIKRVLKTVKRHTCFQVSMTVSQLYGITGIDAVVPYVQSSGGEDDEVETLSL